MIHMLLIPQLLFAINAKENQHAFIKSLSNVECDDVPLTNFSVDVEITGTVAQANYTLTYINQGNDSLVEAKLMLPFDTDVVVSDVVLIYKNRRIVGQLKKKSYAKNIYDQAKKDKNVALLVQRVNDFLSIDLIGIGPNETFIAKISTYTILNLKFNYAKENFFTRYIFPTSMVPRYSPIASSYNKSNNKTPKLASHTSYIFDFKLKTLSGHLDLDSIKSITSLSKNKVNWTLNSLSYTGDVPNDISVDIITNAPNRSIDVNIEHFENSTITEIDLPYEYLSNYRNKTYKETDKNDSFVFLIDRSGSMFGSPIEYAKKALKEFLQSLPSGSFFEIVGFGSEYEYLFGKLVEKNDETFQRAQRYIRAIRSDFGGTEILEPIKNILLQHPDHLIIITDGAVNNNEEIKQFCSKFSTKITTIEIKNYASSDLLKTISRNSGGMYEYVNADYQILDATKRIIASIQNGFFICSIKTNCGTLYQNFPIFIKANTVTPFRFYKKNGYKNNETVFIDLTVHDIKTNEDFSFIIDQNNENIKINDIKGKKLHCIALLKAINEEIIDPNESFEESIRLNLMTKETSFILYDELLLNKNYKIKTIEIPIKAQDNSLDQTNYEYENFFNEFNYNNVDINEEILIYNDKNKLDDSSRFRRRIDFNRKNPERIINNQCFINENNVWDLNIILTHLNININNEDLKMFDDKEKEKLLAGLFSIQFLQKNCNNPGFLNTIRRKITSNYSEPMIKMAEEIVSKYWKN